MRDVLVSKLHSNALRRERCPEKKQAAIPAGTAAVQLEPISRVSLTSAYDIEPRSNNASANKQEVLLGMADEKPGSRRDESGVASSEQSPYVQFIEPQGSDLGFTASSGGSCATSAVAAAPTCRCCHLSAAHACKAKFTICPPAYYPHTHVMALLEQQ
jgi:hypothetical protein